MIRVGIDDLVVVLISLIVLTSLTTVAITKVMEIFREAKKRKEANKHKDCFKLPKRTDNVYKGEDDLNE